MACGPRSPRFRYRSVGDPIDVVSGACFDEALDLKLAALLPFEWWRHTSSARCAERLVLGWGQTHEYDRGLRYDIDGLLYRDPTGDATPFPRIERDGQTAHGGDLTLVRVDAHTYHLHEAGKPSLEFVFAQDATAAPLKRVFRYFEQDEIAFFYHPDGRLKGVRDAAQRLIRVDYNEQGLIAALVLLEREKKRERSLLIYRYDEHSHLTEGVDAYGSTFSFAYDAHHRLIRKTDRNGYAFHFEYDKRGRCVHTRGDDGLFDTRLDYRPLEKTTIVTRFDGGKWTYRYDDSGVVTAIIDPYGGVQQFKLDGQGRVAEEIDPNGNVTRWRYSENGAFLGTDAPPRRHPHQRLANCPLEWEYGDLLSRADIAQRSGLTLSGVDQPNNWMSRNGRFLALLSPTFDKGGLLVKDRGPNDTARRWRYDANGNVQFYLDRDGSIYRKQFVSMNLLQAETDPNEATVTYQYNGAEQITKFTDAGGVPCEFKYDLKDRVTEVHSGGVLHESYHYDAAGNPVEKRDAHGETLLRFTIGPGNRKSERWLRSGEAHRFEYDDRGRFTLAATATTVTAFAYDDDDNRILDERDGRGIQHRFFQTSPKHLTTLFQRFEILYEGSAAGGLLIRDPGGKTHALRVEGALVRRTFSNRVTEAAEFDADGRCLRKIVDHPAPRKAVWERAYLYSGEGDLLTVQDSQEGETRFRYDPAHNLVGMMPNGARERLFRHDLAGNLLEQPGLQAVTLSSANRLANANGERFEYNHRNAIAARIGKQSTARYYYDSRDMLIAVEQDGELRWRASYDPLGRRIGKTYQGNTTEYFWDNNRIAAELHGSGKLRLYLYADPLALTPMMVMDYESLTADPASGLRYFVFADHRGAPIQIEDEAGEIVWRAHMSPYGAVEIEAGAKIEMPLRFPGHYHDPEINLHYNRFRYYSPTLGRYLQPDPAGVYGGYNLYAYSSNPLKEVDVKGLNCPTQQADLDDTIEDDDGIDTLVKKPWMDTVPLGDKDLDYDTRDNQIWLYWNGKSKEPFGPKIHISIASGDIYHASKLLLPKLRELGALHKIAPTQAKGNKINTGKQAGKIITVYPSGAEHALAVQKAVDETLAPYKDAGLIAPGPRPNFREGPNTGKPEPTFGNSDFMTVGGDESK